MTNLKKLFTLFAATAATSLFAGTIDINFDNLPGDGIVPTNYEGLTWSQPGDDNGAANGWFYYGDDQDPYNPSSPPNRVYVLDNVETIDFGQAVTFLGSDFAGYAFSAPYWVGYDEEGNVIDTGDPVAPSGTPTFDSLNWSGVWSVGIMSGGPDFFVIDDIKYSAGGSSAPDVCSTCVLLGIGLAGLLLLRRKQLVA